MKKIFILILGCLLIIKNASAQQYPIFTNYITNSLGFNPAIAGSSECVEVQVTHRQQWVGVADNPRTSIFSMHSRAGKKSPIGLGAIMTADNAGSIKRTGGSAILSYGMRLDSLSYFGLGISAGYYSFQLSEKARVADPTDPTYQSGLQGKTHPDFMAGVYFRRKGLWLGFSTPQIFEKKIVLNAKAKTTNELKRHYYLMAGYEIPVGKNITIEPSAMGRYVENAPLSFDASAKMTFNKKFWLAANYRHGDAISAMAGIRAKSGLNFYYSYDMTMSALSAKSTGSHELGIGMSFCRKKDRDGDGIPDDEDKCPDKPGPKENKGCPIDSTDTKKDLLDTDKDGVLDKDDQCPNVPGPKENKGCPFADRDNDGIRDDIDKCPDIAGTLENQGCPLRDRDRDGIIDEKDPCPDEYGELSNYGCPEGKLPPNFDPAKYGLPSNYDASTGRRFPPPGDTDGDGIPNDKDPDIDGDGIPNDKDPDMDGDGIPNEDDADMDGDNVPNIYDKDMDGDGIPNEKDDDIDGDGIPNSKDPCPRTPGKNGSGCPIVPIEAKNAIDFAVRNIYFDTDKAEIKPASFDYLNRLADWMILHEEFDLDMQGHADNRNSADYNLVLSKNRVNAVKAYLINRGIDSNRIKAEWFGESRPIATGNYEAAWKKNRRVEMQWRFQ